MINSINLSDYIHKNISFQHRSPHTEHPLGLHSVDQKYLTDTFIKVAQIDSACDPIPKTIPSTPGQKTMARILAEELRKIPGVTDITIDPDTFVVYATFPHNLGRSRNVPTIGLLAHVDTSPDVPTKNISPILHKNYQGGDIHLPKNHTTIYARELKNFQGEDIITSDGSTLIGADDKAGVVEILETLRLLSKHPHIKHPTLRVAFTPDEENGFFIDKFDIKSFGVDYCYTLDGGKFNQADVENFNAQNYTVIFHGKKVHTCCAKGVMIDAVKMARDFMNHLPHNEATDNTEGYTGFYHVDDIKGDAEKTEISVMIRDFDDDEIKNKENNIKRWAEMVTKKYPGSKVEFKLEHEYPNQKRFLHGAEALIDHAAQGINKTIAQVNANVNVELLGSRGRFDGAYLTTIGLPSINLGSGQNNLHSKKEFVSVQEMARCVLNVVNILTEWCKPTTVSE